MATPSTAFKIKDEWFHRGQTEVIRQQVQVWNENSGNGIVLQSRRLLGNYADETFYKEFLTDTRRNISATGPIATTALADDEITSVKLNHKQGPHAYNIDAFVKKGHTVETASFVLGQQSQAKKMQQYINRAAVAVVPALTTASMNVSAGGAALTFKALNTGRRKFGDQSMDLVCALMHGDSFHDLIDDGLDNYKVDTVAGAQIVSGGVAGGMGFVLVVTDAPALVGAGTIRHTVLLRPGGIIIDDSEPGITADVVRTGENIFREWQHDYAFNLTLGGFKWDKANGGVNPDDTALGTGTNWDKAVTDDKSLAGVLVSTT